ncbi:MAG: hypothetical protein JSR27_00175 [Proteobacteria bacterium]|nr:hypothetical protein [Pseudomonadota bacterium]
MTRIALYVAVAAALSAACAKQTPADIAASAATNGKDAATAASLATALTNKDKTAKPTPCETDFGASDAAQILTGSTKLNRYAMNAALDEAGNGCEMGDGTGAMIDFSLATKPPANGDNKQYYKFLVSLAQPKGIAFDGVGDEAVWIDVHDSNITGMSEFDTIAIKGEVICRADLHFKKGPDGDKAITPARGVELAKKLGALCNKSFAVHH